MPVYRLVPDLATIIKIARGLRHTQADLLKVV